MVAGMNAGTKIGIAIATYNPPKDFFSQQIDSLLKQFFTNWVCAISDDSVDPKFSNAIEMEVAGDSRFHLFKNSTSSPRGVFHNFENALRNMPPDCEFIAFCDQDDIWAPNKLQRLLEALDQNPGKQLIHSDLKLIDELGAALHPSCWQFEKRKFDEPDSLLRLILRNRVTGCATLFRRELLQLVLPFPKSVDSPYLHDHWVAALALVAGGIIDLPEPLVSYRQHGTNVIGAARKGFAKKLARLPQFNEKSKKALQDRQRLAVDIIQRISEKLPHLKEKTVRELSPLTEIHPYFFLKQLVQTKGQFPEVGLGLQLLWASLQRPK